MKAVRKMREGKGNVELVEVPEPKIGPKDVLMKVWAAGVCGSDLNIQDDVHFYTAPVTLGHEYSGVAVEVGSEVAGVKVGDKIVADIETDEGWLGVNVDGAYAPLMRVPGKVVHVCPQDMSLDAAGFAEPVVATLHCLQERSRICVGDFVVVVGPGPMGVLAVQFAKLAGAKAVVLTGLRTDEGRLWIGKQVGADYILYAEENPVDAVMDLTRGEGADFVAECSGSELGLQQAIDVAKKSPQGRGGRGRIALIGMWGKRITLSFDPVSMGQLDMSGGWSWNGPETWERAIDLLYRGCFDYRVMITNRYPLEEWERALANLRARKDLKAFIHPNGTDWAK